MGVLEEILDDWSKAWRTRFVRAIKDDPITRAESLRSRLVTMGTGHQEGKEYYDNYVPTPMWSTTLMLIGECTVAHGIDFQFDLPEDSCHAAVTVLRGNVFAVSVGLWPGGHSLNY